MAYFMEDEHLSGHALSDEEHEHDDHNVEDEIEALQSLPPDERRKALRRLRNRESARRVRARRLAEMGGMEVKLKSTTEENEALKGHVQQLQGHISAMTYKIYEVTAKYEAAVAENVRLKAELKGQGMVPMLGEVPFSSSVLLPQQQAHKRHSTGVMLPEAADLAGQDVNQTVLSHSHAQLRSGTPNSGSDEQRHKVAEVVMLLQEHRRRTEAVKDRNCGSEHASSVNNFHIMASGSPLSDTHALGRGRASLDMPAPAMGNRSSLDLQPSMGGRASLDVPPSGGAAVKHEGSASAPLMTLCGPSAMLAAQLMANQQPYGQQQGMLGAQQQQVGFGSDMLFGMAAAGLGQQDNCLSAPLYYTASSMRDSSGAFATAATPQQQQLAQQQDAAAEAAALQQQHRQQQQHMMHGAHRTSSFAMDYRGASGMVGGGPQAGAAAQAAAAAQAFAQQQQQQATAHMTWPGAFGGPYASKEDILMDFDDCLAMPQDL